MNVMKSLGLVLLVIVTGCKDEVQKVIPPRPALVMVVSDVAVTDAMSLVGEVRPRYESIQGFRIGGKIVERNVNIGDTVHKGQVLVKLDPSDVQFSASADEADVRAAEADRVLASTEYSRFQQLFAKKFVSASALDMKKAQLKSANARVSQAKAKARISSNQARYAHLTAGQSGVVTWIFAEPGQVVQAGEKVVQIAETREKEVVVAVPESRINEVQIAAQVTVRLWANPKNAYTGQVREISPAADSATRAYDVRVSIVDGDDLVKLGSTARVKFDQQNIHQRQGLLIPSAALTEINGKKMVWVIDVNNKAQQREVEVGQFGEQGVIVLSGLNTGEKIAIAGVHVLIQGQQVKPVEAPSS